MVESPELTEEQIQSKWDEMSPLIDRVQERTGARGEFPVHCDSSLRGDDDASNPYQVSHAVQMCFTAGVDHLHAVKSLVVDQRIIHVAAPATLSRGALETFAAAFWILDPASRDERISRALRWYVQNLKDGETAMSDLGVPHKRPYAERLGSLQKVAASRGISAKIESGYSSTEAVKWADAHAGTVLGVLFPWRLCSGYAHGRPWAYIGTSLAEVTQTEEPDVKEVKLETSYAATLYPALAALHLLEAVLRTYRSRANRGLIV